MPKDDFDFQDPFELHGMVLPAPEDTTREMAECFAEEFLRLGYGSSQILALFRNPHYLGPNLAWERQGEAAVRDTIAEVFARWGKAVDWQPQPPKRMEESAT